MDDQLFGVVLLVEDEPLVRLVTAEILADAKFQIIEAANAEEALTVLRAGVMVDVLLSDVEMPPGITGYELAWQVYGHWTTIEILITSGREWPREGDLPPRAAFLAKPCPHSALVLHVRAAAERARTARALSLPGDQPPTKVDDAAVPCPKIA